MHCIRQTIKLRHWRFTLTEINESSARRVKNTCKCKEFRHKAQLSMVVDGQNLDIAATLFQQLVLCSNMQLLQQFCII